MSSIARQSRKTKKTARGALNAHDKRLLKRAEVEHADGAAPRGPGVVASKPLAPRVQRAINKAMSRDTAPVAANQAFADGFDAHTGYPGAGKVLLEVHRLYSKMPPHWIAHAFSCLGANLKKRPESRERALKRLHSRSAPHTIAGLAWGLAHRDTVDGLVSAAFLLDHAMGGKNKPEALRVQRAKIRKYFECIPRSRFSIQEVIRRFEERPLPSSDLATAVHARLAEPMANGNEAAE